MHRPSLSEWIGRVQAILFATEMVGNSCPEELPGPGPSRPKCSSVGSPPGRKPARKVHRQNRPASLVDDSSNAAVGSLLRTSSGLVRTCCYIRNDHPKKWLKCAKPGKGDKVGVCEWRKATNTCFIVPCFCKRKHTGP